MGYTRQVPPEGLQTPAVSFLVNSCCKNTAFLAVCVMLISLDKGLGKEQGEEESMEGEEDSKRKKKKRFSSALIISRSC